LFQQGKDVDEQKKRLMALHSKVAKATKQVYFYHSFDIIYIGSIKNRSFISRCVLFLYGLNQT